MFGSGQKRQDPLRDKHSRAREQGDGEQAPAFVRCDDGDNKSCKRGVYACGGVEDRRKSHGGEAGVRYIVQKRSDVDVGDLLLGQCERKHADQVGHACHHKDIEIDVVFHVTVLLCLNSFVYIVTQTSHMDFSYAP